MPYFFQFSKNGRKLLYDRSSKKKKYAKINHSTMNRICRRFDDIGHINMNVANIPPFNWQMLMPREFRHFPHETTTKIITTFCDMDSANIANIIEAKEYEDAAEKMETFGYDLVSDAIREELESIGGNLKDVYPYVVKYLFTGENFRKPSHKQMFWRVFGDIAIEHLEQNLQDYSVCDCCGAKIPSWHTEHVCVKNGQGYFECVDCGSICERVNSRQCRCEDCQKEYRKIQHRTHVSVFQKKRSKSTQEKDEETYE